MNKHDDLGNFKLRMLIRSLLNNKRDNNDKQEVKNPDNIKLSKT